VKRQWHNGNNDVWYYHSTEDGRICGQSHKIAHTNIWVAKTISNYNEERYVGIYITLNFAMIAVEKAVDIEDRTLIE
jgi:hypothetical protein